MIIALPRERTASPVRPPLPQPHPGQLGHEIEFGRPRVPMMRVEPMGVVASEPVVVRSEPLLGEIVRVEAEVLVRHTEGMHGLTGWHPTQLRDSELDDETTAMVEVRGGV